MSSGSSGRYQSRLFNFVHQQSRRLTTQWEHTFRHLQVASKWGVELLLYPLYLLFNSTESAGKTLGTKETQSRFQLPANHSNFPPENPPNADVPIQQVLELVKNLSSESSTAKPSLISAPRKFLGTLWGTFWHRSPTQFNCPESLTLADNSDKSIKHQLSLVQGIATNLHNRNLVIVTAENGILDIFTPRQQAKLKTRISNALAVAATQQQTQLLPDINRILVKLTGVSTVLPQQTPKNLLYPHKLIVFLDGAIAKLETNALLPVQYRSQEMIRVTQTQLDIWLYGQAPANARENLVVNADNLKTKSWNFSALLEAALNYFFGVRQGKQLDLNNNQQNLTGSNEDLIIDPWLNFSDLFGNSDNIADQQVGLKTSPQIAASSSKKTADEGQKVGRLIHNFTQKITQAKQTDSNISQSITENQPNSQIEFQPDWIDVEAIFLGYDKHPLEQILGWLDGLMLWWETILVKVFQRLQRLWRGK